MSEGCGPIAVTVGEDLPAMSVSWVKPTSPYDSGYVVFFADADLDADESIPVCLNCLVRDGDEQLGRGLDLARVHGQVDYNPVTGDWFVPEDRPPEFIPEADE